MGRRGRGAEEGGGGMSQVRCTKCNGLWPVDQRSAVGARCGTRAGLGGWVHCDGILVEHQCGGPREACGLKGCERCHRQPKQEPKRDALWHAIYAAEFVRRVADAQRFNAIDGDMVAREADEAKALADWHHEVVPKEER